MFEIQHRNKLMNYSLEFGYSIGEAIWFIGQDHGFGSGLESMLYHFLARRPWTKLLKLSEPQFLTCSMGVSVT